MSTEIQWTDETWNPVTGCSKVSPGCAHCYAEGVANRFWASQYPPVEYDSYSVDACCPITEMRARQFTDVMTHADRLDQPLRWKKPRRIFVNSMSDLFHEAVPDAFIDRVFVVMARAPRHTFQILTKRAERMRDYLKHSHELELSTRVVALPLPNVWLGVSVENQHFADERIPLLLHTPAAVRFISAEPLLGPMRVFNDANDPACGMLDWVIVGGESGADARPFDLAWARSIVRQCQAVGVAVFMKQLGTQPWVKTANHYGPGVDAHPYNVRYQLKNKKGGDMAEWPEDLRVRQFPAVATTDRVTRVSTAR